MRHRLPCQSESSFSSTSPPTSVDTRSVTRIPPRKACTLFLTPPLFWLSKVFSPQCGLNTLRHISTEYSMEGGPDLGFCSCIASYFLAGALGYLLASTCVQQLLPLVEALSQSGLADLGILSSCRCGVYSWKHACVVLCSFFGSGYGVFGTALVLVLLLLRMVGVPLVVVLVVVCIFHAYSWCRIVGEERRPENRAPTRTNQGKQHLWTGIPRLARGNASRRFSKL